MQLLQLQFWISNKRCFLGFTLLLLLFSLRGFAQPVSGVKSVDIISNYKPVIRKFTKFQFLPNLPASDTSRLSLRYSIPAQSWQSDFILQPVLPLAYQKDSSVPSSSVYIKAGFGNFRSPYLRAHLSGSSPQSHGYSFTGFHQSARGSQNYQQFVQSGMTATGFKKLSTRPYVLNGKVDFNRDVVFRYGLPVGITTPVIDSVKRTFARLGATLGFNRTVLTEFGIHYQGNLSINSFSDNNGGRETTLGVHIPVQKYIDQNWTVGVDLNAQSVQLKNLTGPLQNNTVGLFLGLKHTSSALNFCAGINPFWDKLGAQLLPQLSFSYQLDSSRLVVIGGWEGKFMANTYQHFFTINNWLNAPARLLNTVSKQLYLGLKGSPSPYFSYAIQGSSIVHQNMPLFVNDTARFTTRNSFFVVYEPRLVQLQLKGEVNYQVGQRVHLFSALQLNRFSRLVQQKKAWGLLPVEWKSGSRVALGDNFYWQTDLMVWQGASFLQADGKANRLKGAVDLTTQLEFKFAKSWQAWTRIGNLFNQPYQRWTQFPVYGLNFMAGVVFSPQPKRKS